GLDETDTIELGHHQVGEQQLVFAGAQILERLLRRAVPSGSVALDLQRGAQRLHLRHLIVHHEQPGRHASASRDSSGRPDESPTVASSARACRRSFRRGGLFSTRLTSGGMSFSATSRCPQPVSMITGVIGEAALTAAATRRPSTCGIPRSVITSANGLPAFTDAVKVSMPACPPPATVTACP